MASFQSISGPAEGFYKEKGSRFLGFAFPVSGEDEIEAHLALLKQEHPKARHICYAWILGAAKLKFRASDDGEPHHSAGTPILGQLHSFGVTNTLLAVVRYFGGTKLGVGGLTAAYKEAAHDTLAHTTVIEDSEKIIIRAEVAYSHFNELMNFVKQNNVRILEQKTSDICELMLSVKAEEAESIKSGLVQMQISILWKKM